MTWPLQFPLAAFVLVLLTCIPPSNAAGQSFSRLRRGQLQTSLDAQIGNQQVQRQSEVMRLERMLRQFESRVMRLERQLMASSRLPAITMAEASAAVEFAKVQMQESKRLHEKGEIDEVDLAADRLALAHAQGQYESAKSAHEESVIQLELDVLFAERNLLDRANESSQLERLAAKGHVSSSGLAFRKLDVSLAEKQLQRARVRLEGAKKSSGTSEPPANEE